MLQLTDMLVQEVIIENENVRKKMLIEFFYYFNICLLSNNYLMDTDAFKGLMIALLIPVRVLSSVV
jgi:hypothetical protein